MFLRSFPTLKEKNAKGIEIGYFPSPISVSFWKFTRLLGYNLIVSLEYYAVERKKELLPFATAWMELESIMLTEISQVVRDKYYMISPLTGT